MKRIFCLFTLFINIYSYAQTATFSNTISVLSFGADTTFKRDATKNIQDAIELAHLKGGGEVFIPAGRYRTTAPIVLYGNVKLTGEGKGLTRIIKITNSTGNKGNVKSANGEVDNFNNDAVLQVYHENSKYAYDVTIRGISFDGNPDKFCTYAIYAPCCSRLSIDDIFTGNTIYGFFTNDTWLSSITNSVFDRGNYGIFWKEGGTSLHLSHVFVTNSKTCAFYFKGLSYSSFDNLACDFFNAKGVDLSGTPLTGAYVFEACKGITINSIGCEASNGKILFVSNSNILINGMVTHNINGYKNLKEDSYIYLTSNAIITLNSSVIEPMTNRGNFKDLILINSSRLNNTNTVLDTKGGEVIQNKSLKIVDGSYTDGINTWNMNSENGFAVQRNGSNIWDAGNLLFSDGLHYNTSTKTLSADLILKNLKGSGKGVTTITIPHEIGFSPASMIVGATSSASANISYYTWDKTNVYIHYTIAPAIGTNNLLYSISYKNSTN